MTTKRLKILLRFLQEIEKLKRINRQVKISNKKRWESSAEHSWDLAMWAWIFSNDLPPAADLFRIIKLLLMHDLVEIYAGDTFLFDHAKRRRKAMVEAKAAKKLFRLLTPDLQKEFKALWLEFEAGKSREAKVAKSIDRLQPILQNIVSDGYGWKKHNVTEEDIRKYKRDHMVHDKTVLQIFEALIRDAKRARLI